MTIRVTVWSEFRQERSDAPVKAVYPDGIHAAIAAGLRAGAGDLEVRTATLDEPEHGLSEAVLAETDVLTWWGHVAHDEVSDAVVDRVHARVLDGMGLVVLHSGHFSRIFRRLMGTSCDLKWREDGRRERLWVVDPSHPIAEGLGESFVIGEEEMYGEHFDIPAPDELVLVSWFEGGEVFRIGLHVAPGTRPRRVPAARARDAPDLLRPQRPPADRERRALVGRRPRRAADVRERAARRAARPAGGRRCSRLTRSGPRPRRCSTTTSTAASAPTRSWTWRASTGTATCPRRTCPSSRRGSGAAPTARASSSTSRPSSTPSP